MKELSELHKALLLAKKVTEFRGEVLPIQQFQLQVWPKFIPGAKKHVVLVDTESKGVKLNVKVKGPVGVKVEEMCTKIVHNIHWLLGDDWTVEFVIESDKKTKTLSYPAVGQSREKWSGTDFAAGVIVPDKLWPPYQKPTELFSLAPPPPVTKK